MCRRMIFLVSFVLVLVLVLTNFAQADLIGYWEFEESSGIIAADSVDGDNDGILFGEQLEWTAGRFGGALSFPGVPDHARVEFLTTGMSATAGTVAMWGLLTDPQPETEGRYFFGHTTQPQWANCIQIYMQDTTELDSRLLDIGLGSSHSLDTDIMELPMEEWLHIVLTWDAGNYVVYVNGEVVSSGAYTGLSEIHPTANIGNDGSIGPYESFAGLLDDVQLYDHALNAAEILAAMEGVEKVDVTAPGDLVQGVPNDGITYDSGNFGWYRWESPDLAIDDNIETKYLHFKGEIESTGFQVTPSAGPSIVTGLTLTTANDFPARDPIAFELSGSNVSINGPYELIASGYIVDFAQAEAWPRLATNATPISFHNDEAYSHYQVLFPVVRDAGNANSMQIAEVELLGVPAPAPAPGGANIILVTEAIDWNMDGLRDDHSLESFLISEGHRVDVRPDYWKVLTPGKIAELNAADLIIVSRLAWSDRYDEGNETTDWNSLTTPLLQMNAYFARNTRWKWVNSWAGSPAGDTPLIYAEAVDPLHPIFIDMLLSSYALAGRPDVVQMIDPLVGTGVTSFIGTTDMGNGHLIAKSVQLSMGWIAEWDAGVEFFEGSGQYAGGKRMLFCAGTQEIQYYDYDRQEVITTAQGELNLTAEGLQMFRNAINYLLGGVNIILVTEAIDYDWDGLRDDHSLESFLISEGHSVDVRPEYWNELTPDKIAELNAADLIIVSRLGWSSRYNQGNEKTEWNSLKTPLLTMNSHFARNSRWNWVNSDARAPDDTSYIYAGAVDSHHPIFQGVPMTLYDPTLRGGPLNATQMIDPLVGTGFTAFIGGTDMGNGQLIAKPVGLEMGWIAEWDAGVEFYEGAGQFAGGKRMLFCAGTFSDPDRQEVITRAQGELNLTAEGLQMFRNAIDYLLNPEFADIYDESTECIVAHWKLDEIEGGIAYDSVGDNDGILYGNPIWRPMGGMLGGALEFDGDNDYVDCGTFNPSDATGQLSICLWAKWNGLNGRYQSLICKRNSWNVNDMMWQLEANHISGDAMFEREGYAGVIGGILTEGDWEHWCVTFDGATAIIYRMGGRVNRGAFSFGSKTDAQVVLGGSNTANRFNGALDDVRIYDCALDDNQIKSLISAHLSLNSLSEALDASLSFTTDGSAD